MSKPRTVPAFPNIPVAGGLGTVPAWSRPDMVVTAPGGVVTVTPGHTVMSAGATASLAASRDVNFSSQRHTAVVVKNGISLFTVGKATDPNKPNQETGMALHAGTGSVSVQAQSNALSLTADQSIQLASTTDNLTASAPKHLLLTAGGSAIRLTNGNITLTTPATATFNAAMRELAGGASASAGLQLPKARALYDEQFLIVDQDSQQPLAGEPYRIEDADGNLVASGITDDQGRTARVTTTSAKQLKIFWGH